MIYNITSVRDPRVAFFLNLRNNPLQNQENANGSEVCIVESPKVIRTALSCGYTPVSLLCEEKHITGDAAEIISLCGENTPIYTGSRDVLSEITGYVLTRGVLCAMKRRPLPTVNEIVSQASRIAVIDGVCDNANIGSIFRAAAALGIDGILLTPESCDPLNRRSIRVSMGSVFQIPWCWLDAPIKSLKNFGFKTVAMALKPDSICLDDIRLKNEPRLAIILGTEGDGLKDNVIEEADYSVVIPMHNNVDSLNVASAAAVTFWELRKKI